MLVKSKNYKAVYHRKWGTERIYYMSHSLSNSGWNRLSYLFKYLNLLVFRCFIPPEVVIGERLDLPHGGFGVVIHKNTRIGDDAIIFHNVTIAEGGANIGDRVYIGTGTVIIGSVTIGSDVKIGANCIVNFDVPSNSTVVSPVASIK